MIDLKRLAIAVRTRRGSKSYDAASIECGLSKGTLSNLEHERTQPDMETLFKICDWTDLPVDYFRAESAAEAA